jgi:hypothetical protein
MLLTALAGDPRIPDAFRESCLALRTRGRRSGPGEPVWVTDLLAALDANPPAGDRSPPKPGCRRDDRSTLTGGYSDWVLRDRLRGVDAETAIVLLGATDDLSALVHATALVPDPDGVLGRNILTRTANTVMLREVLRTATDPGVRRDVCLALCTPELSTPGPGTRGPGTPGLSTSGLSTLGRPVDTSPRYLHADDREHIVNLAARTPGLREQLLAVATDPEIVRDLTRDSDLAASGAPTMSAVTGRRCRERPTPVPAGLRWRARLLSGELDAAAAAAELTEAGSGVSGERLSLLWRTALAVTADPDGVLAEAARLFGRTEVLSAIVNDCGAPLAIRRRAALDLASTGTLTSSWTALPALLCTGPTEWVRAVAEVAVDHHILLEAVTLPGVPTAALLTDADVRLEVGSSLLGDCTDWNRFLLTCEQTPQQLRVTAAARLSEYAAALANYRGENESWLSTYCADIAAAFAPDSPRAGVDVLLDLPVAHWAAAHNGWSAVATPPAWWDDALGVLLAAVTEEAPARCLLALAGPGTFTGSARDLIAAVDGITGR